MSTSKLVLAFLSTVFVQNTLAGGLISYEIGTPDLGLASAGYAARAQDAATAMTNPAGMTRLCSSELMVGLQPLYGNVKFSPNSSTNVGGNDGGNALGWFPGGGGYFVYSMDEDLKFGLSTYGNFGLPLHYNGQWVGRYYATSATLLGITVAPSMAYRIHDMWSVGISLNAMYGMLSQKAAVNNSPLGLFGAAADGELAVKNNTWGWGTTIGFLFEPTDFTRFGFTYTSEIDLDFKDRVQFTNAFPIIIPAGSFSTPLDLKVTVPQMIMLSFYHDYRNNWAILGNLGWQNWERFGKVDVTVGSANPASLIDDLEYKNTWHAALGTQYALSECGQLSMGVAYDSNMLEDGRRSVSLPIGSAWRFGLGAQYFVSEAFEIGVGYTLLWGGDLSVDQSRNFLTGRVAGDYNNSAINYFGVNVDWKF